MSHSVLGLAIVLCLGGWRAPPLSAQETRQSAEWVKLPSLPEARGLGGLFAGVSGDALLVAGGTNFRDKPPWEGGTKSWYDTIYALSPGHPSWRAVGKLPRPLSYGALVETDRGLLCTAAPTP